MHTKSSYRSGELAWLVPGALSLRHSQREVGAKAVAGGRRSCRHLSRGRVHPPHRPGGHHTRVLGLGGEHVLRLVLELVLAGTGLAVAGGARETEGGVRGAAGELEQRGAISEEWEECEYHAVPSL